MQWQVKTLTSPTLMSPFRRQLYFIIFGTTSKWGKRFDMVLILLISTSVVLVICDSIPSIHQDFFSELNALEWAFTLLFTVEYLLRIYASPKPLRYVFSFFGLVDFIAIVPTYLALFFTGPEYFATIRAIRILRVFRVLKLAKYLLEAEELTNALKRSFPKIFVFVGTVFIITVISGTVIFLIEGPENGFTNIPTGIYWAIVTLTTVGFGDVVPTTIAGKIFASILMILGYGIIAVPTGIVSAEMVSRIKKDNKLICPDPDCDNKDHEFDSSHCRHCGSRLIQVK